MDKLASTAFWFLVTLLWTICFSNVQGQMASLVMAGLEDDNAIKDLMTEEDDTVTVICHAMELTETNIVSITRATVLGADGESLLWNNSQPDSETTQHIEYDGFVEIAPGIFLYTMIIHNVTKFDSGDYACTIFDQSGNRFTPVTSAQSNLRVLHFPEDVYPICEITSADKSLTMQVDDVVTFRCESEVGDPEVFLDWSLSARRPSLPRPSEYTRDRMTYSEISITLEEGHSGKVFECEYTSGLDISNKPKCTIGPYTVMPKPTSPRPTTTVKTTRIRPDIPPNPSKSDIVVEPSISPTKATGSTTESDITMRSPPAPSGLGKAAIAGIVVIIVLSIGIILMIIVCWLIRTNQYWSPDSKTPINEKSPNTSHMSGGGDDGPQLLGFKKRFSRKASLKTDTLREKQKGFENAGMMLPPPNETFEAINETGESRPTTPLSPHRPPTLNPLFGLANMANNDNVYEEPKPEPSPRSPNQEQPFLPPTTQSDDGFTTPPDSPGATETAEESPDQPAHSPDDSASPGAPATHARNPSFISVDDSDHTLEGEFVSDSEPQGSPEPVNVFDPSTPRNLPQDVMDILNDLDLDLFANENTEDTML